MLKRHSFHPKVSDSVPAPETLPPKEETRIEAVGAASNLQCIQEGPSVTPKSATVLSDPPSRSSSVDGLNPNPSIILSPHVLVIDSTEVPQDRDVNSTSSVINTVSTCSRKGTSEANQEHLNSLEGETGEEDKCSAQQTDGNDAVVTENDDTKKTRNSDEKEQKEEESGGVVSRIREKIQEELSCAICNEVFISVRKWKKCTF